jgi:hypothetical protein
MSALDQIERAYIISGSLFPLCISRMYVNLMCESVILVIDFYCISFARFYQCNLEYMISARGKRVAMLEDQPQFAITGR